MLFTRTDIGTVPIVIMNVLTDLTGPHAWVLDFDARLTIGSYQMMDRTASLFGAKSMTI